MFDKLKKKDVQVNETPIVAPEKDEEKEDFGWDYISAAFDAVYTKEYNHYGPIVKWSIGGNDPLDGISVYDGGDYWHFVSYGLSEIYEKETDDKDISGFGMEFTFKLKKDNYDDEEAEIKCVCGILQSIARITFKNAEIFNAFEYLYTGQKTGIDAKMKSNIIGFIIVPDENVKSIDTPNGKVDFVEFIGATDAELLAIKNGETSVRELYEKLGIGVTDYNRISLY